MTTEGWYRTGNGYEYKYFDSQGTYGETTTACQILDPSATLAAAGVRDQTLSKFVTAIFFLSLLIYQAKEIDRNSISIN